MGTRGVIGFVGTLHNEQLHKVSYNHWDSYPSGLGYKVVEYIQSKNFNEIRKDFSNIELVVEGDEPTLEQKLTCSLAETTDTNVGGQTEDDWYCLLRNAQGDLGLSAKIGYMIDSKDFLYDSLFCEWAYLLNMDTQELEIYRGFQHDEDTIKGRYREGPLKGYDRNFTGSEPSYFAVSLIKTVPFKEVTKKLMYALEEKIKKEYDNE